jgi:hypothetical protein
MFLDKDFAMKHGLELIKEARSTSMEVIDGWLLTSGNVMEETQSLEVISFNAMQIQWYLVFHGLSYITLMLIGICGGFLQNKIKYLTSYF